MKREIILIVGMFIFFVLFSLVSMEVAYGNIESDLEITEEKLDKGNSHKIIVDNEVYFRNDRLKVIGK